MKEPSMEKMEELFRNYVEGMGDTPRHTEQTYNKLAVFESIVEKYSGLNYDKRHELLDPALEVMVEFEFSGFIAGYRAALRSR